MKHVESGNSLHERMSELCVLTTRHLVKSFAGVPAVNDLNLQVRRGQVYGFLGPNGAGRTTTIRLLLGLIRPDRGQITVFGRNLPEHRKEIISKVGALVEAPSIYPCLTGRENLRVLAHLVNIRANRIDEVLQRVQLSDAAEKKSRAILPRHEAAAGARHGAAQRAGVLNPRRADKWARPRRHPGYARIAQAAGG